MSKYHIVGNHMSGLISYTTTMSDVSFLACVNTVPVIMPRREKTLFCNMPTIKTADQFAHQRSLISSFVIDFLGYIITPLAICKFSIFWQVTS